MRETAWRWWYRESSEALQEEGMLLWKQGDGERRRVAVSKSGRLNGETK